jgi:uncharacterized protein (DUF1499 family)
MNDATATPAWWSRALLIGAIVAVALLPVGALGTRLGVWSFQIGLLLLAAGAALALAALVLGVVALIVAVRKGRVADRPLLYGTLVVAGCVVLLMGSQFNTARSVPPIHDISTDMVDPPAFDVIVSVRAPTDNSLDYDVKAIAPQQRAAYPNVKPLSTGRDVGASFDQALEVLSGMGLEIVNADRDAGRIEATATSFWFGFKDDVVVRIRPAAGGAVVDVRSVSRVGVSDIGVNARRIEEFLTRFDQQT